VHKIKSHKSVEQIAKKHRLEVSFVEKQLKMGIPIEHEHTKDKDLATDIALQHLDEIPDYYTRLKKMETSAKKSHDKKYKDVTEEKGLWANIHARRKRGLPPKKPGEKGYPKTLDIEEGLKQARKNVGASKCWSNKKVGNPPTKIKGGKEVPNCVPIKEDIGSIRYCPRCKKDETSSECKYGSKYWEMFSVPSNLKLDAYDPNSPHPGNLPEEKDHEHSMARSEISTIISAANRLKKKMKGEGNIEAWVQSKITKAADYLDSAADYVDSGEMNKEQVSFEIGSGHRQAQKQAKIRNLATGTTNKGEKEAALRKLSGPSLPLADSYEYSNWREDFGLSEDWQKVNRKDKTDGLSQSAVNAYRRENPGSKLQTAVTEKKPTGKRAERRKSFCSRMKRYEG